VPKGKGKKIIAKFNFLLPLVVQLFKQARDFLKKHYRRKGCKLKINTQSHIHTIILNLDPGKIYWLIIFQKDFFKFNQNSLDLLLFKETRLFLKRHERRKKEIKKEYKQKLCLPIFSTLFLKKVWLYADFKVNPI
jgi:hypothetical protein